MVCFLLQPLLRFQLYLSSDMYVPFVIRQAETVVIYKSMTTHYFLKANCLSYIPGTYVFIDQTNIPLSLALL